MTNEIETFEERLRQKEIIRSEWLKNLKVGDKVAIDRGRGTWSSRYEVGTVTKITPTGQVQINNKEPKFRNGYVSSGNKWDLGVSIHELTDEIKEQIFRDKMTAKLENMKFKELSTEQLREIQKILENK